MTALSASRHRQWRLGDLIEPAVADGQTVHEGSLVEFTGSGRAQPHVAGAGKHIAGVATTAGEGDSDGTVRVQVRRRGIFRFSVSGTMRATHVGDLAYGADDNTVTNVSGGTPVGTIVDADGGSAAAAPDAVWVDLLTFANLLD